MGNGLSWTPFHLADGSLSSYNSSKLSMRLHIRHDVWLPEALGRLASSSALTAITLTTITSNHLEPPRTTFWRKNVRAEQCDNLVAGFSLRVLWILSLDSRYGFPLWILTMNSLWVLGMSSHYEFLSRVLTSSILFFPKFQKSTLFLAQNRLFSNSLIFQFAYFLAYSIKKIFYQMFAMLANIYESFPNRRLSSISCDHRLTIASQYRKHFN